VKEVVFQLPEMLSVATDTLVHVSLMLGVRMTSVPTFHFMKHALKMTTTERQGAMKIEGALDEEVSFLVGGAVRGPVASAIDEGREDGGKEREDEGEGRENGSVGGQVAGKITAWKEASNKVQNGASKKGHLAIENDLIHSRASFQAREGDTHLAAIKAGRRSLKLEVLAIVEA